MSDIFVIAESNGDGFKRLRVYDQGLLRSLFHFGCPIISKYN